MFDGLRDEVDKARWKQQWKRWRKEAAKALGVKRGEVYFVEPADAFGNVLVAYFRSPNGEREVWCLRVNTTIGRTMGEPLRFAATDDWMAHARAGEWERAWPGEPSSWGGPMSVPKANSGLPMYPWDVMQRILEKHYGIESGQPWTREAEEQFATDMLDARDGSGTPELLRMYRQLTDPELRSTYEEETDPELIRTYRWLMALMPGA